ncbi:U-scoloptoxin(05)-Sm1a [Sergentomyia squamirostris]
MNLLVYSLTFLAIFRTVSSIRCFVCNATDTSSPFQCGELFERYDTPDIEPSDCSDVHGAQYCIKHIGRFEGGIGAKRFCSSKDLGNYCNYVQNVGDKMEYRSCIFTCSTDGCNLSTSLTSSHLMIAIASMISLLLATIA